MDNVLYILIYLCNTSSLYLWQYWFGTQQFSIISYVSLRPMLVVALSSPYHDRCKVGLFSAYLSVLKYNHLHVAKGHQVHHKQLCAGLLNKIVQSVYHGRFYSVCALHSIHQIEYIVVYLSGYVLIIKHTISITGGSNRYVHYAVYST